MNLGLFLAIGESFGDFEKKGQLTLIKNYLLENYSRNFEKVFVFSYVDESVKFFPNVYVLPNKWRLPRYLYALLMPALYRSEIKQCDILRGLQLTGAIPAGIAKIFFKKPFVFNYGYDYSQMAKIEKKPFQAFLFGLIKWPIFLLADYIIVTAKYLKENISRSFWETKIVWIPNGVDTGLFKPGKVRRTNNRLIFVGRFEEQKNLKNLIQAVGKVRNLELTLELIGKGSLENEFKKLATRFKVNLILNKPISHYKLPQILKNYNLFVLPSYIEGQPKALLEAMSCGLPVLASDIPAHREIIKHKVNGYLCSTDVTNIANALEEVVNNKFLQEKMSKNARITIEKIYNKNILQQKEIALLRNILQNHE